MQKKDKAGTSKASTLIVLDSMKNMEFLEKCSFQSYFTLLWPSIRKSGTLRKTCWWRTLLFSSATFDSSLQCRQLRIFGLGATLSYINFMWELIRLTKRNSDSFITQCYSLDSPKSHVTFQVNSPSPRFSSSLPSTPFSSAFASMAWSTMKPKYIELDATFQTFSPSHHGCSSTSLD